jgi:hypothetical protein
MRLFRRRAGEHRARVLQVDEGPDAIFVWACSCATASEPYSTEKEAFRGARRHAREVDDEVEVLRGEGGVGWLCMFCGSTVEQAPVRLSLTWTDDGVDREQWYASHRECLLERIAADEGLTPQFSAVSADRGP